MKPTVMVLDDEPLILDVLQNSLSLYGFEVVCTKSEAEFWQQVKLHEISLFLLDLTLPDGSGLNIAKKIRDSSEVGIIIESGNNDELSRVVCLELGVDDYVTKPYSPRELAARITSVLRRTRGVTYTFGAEKINDADTSKTVSFDGWNIHLHSRRVVAPNNEEIELTTTEFELLRTFVLGANRVYTRDQLMNSVKGQEWIGYDRAIDGLISRLRKKISPSQKGKHYFKTIRNVGYMFSFKDNP